jgi:hypothetical protein
MIRLVVGALLSAVVLMVWGAVFWMVLPWGHSTIKGLPNEDAVARVLRDAVPESGSYFYPYPDPALMKGHDPEAREIFTIKNRRGPVFQLVYRKEGLDANDPSVFGFGFAHFAAASFLAGLLLWAAAPRHYAARVLFVAGAGVFASVAVTLSNPIWFHHPWHAALVQAGFDVGCWVLAGLVLGALVRPAPAPAAAWGAFNGAAVPDGVVAAAGLSPRGGRPSP